MCFTFSLHSAGWPFLDFTHLNEGFWEQNTVNAVSIDLSQVQHWESLVEVLCIDARGKNHTALVSNISGILCVSWTNSEVAWLKFSPLLSDCCQTVAWFCWQCKVLLCFSSCLSFCGVSQGCTGSKMQLGNLLSSSPVWNIKLKHTSHNNFIDQCIIN